MADLVQRKFNRLGANVANVIKKMFTLPSVGLPCSIIEQSKSAATYAWLQKFGLLRGVPICATKQELIGENKLGQQIIIRTSEEGNSEVTDNVTPSGRRWKVEGYLTLDFLVVMPTLLGLGPAVYTLKRFTESSVLLTLAKTYLEYLRKLRAPFYFTTADGNTVKVIMNTYTLTDVPEVANACAVTLDVKEYVVLETNGSTDKLNVPVVGLRCGMATALGGTVATMLTTSISTMSDYWNKAGNNKLDEDLTLRSILKKYGKVRGAQYETEFNYLKSLGVNSTVWEAFTKDKRKNYCVIDKPFSSYATIDDALTTSITFNGNTVDVTIRRRFTSRTFTLDEKGTVNGKAFTWNGVLHMNAIRHVISDFMLIPITPCAFDASCTDKQLVTAIQNMSFLVKY